jgi:hypothetical protein
MQNQNSETSECTNDDCPYMKPHKHVVTSHGDYIKYIIEKPKHREIHDADSWR